MPNGRRARLAMQAYTGRERGRFVASADERQPIKAAAADARMSGSAYLRALGLGYTLKSAFEEQAVQALVKAVGD